MREPNEVASRCLLLELLLQRFGLETDTDDPAEQRELVRASWLARLPDLGLDVIVSPEERALLERPVGGLSDDELDDLHGRAAGALVLLWALGRLTTRPSFAEVDAMETIVLDHGLLGDGSIAGAKSAVTAATLRLETEIESTCKHYERVRGKAREPSSAEAIAAGIGAHHLGWVLDPEMAFEIA